MASKLFGGLSVCVREASLRRHRAGLRGVKDVLLKGFKYRNRFRRWEMTAHGMKVMAGRLTMQM
ncbi:hypothetical protein NB063_08355 [Rhodopirellula sp. ICT_H3.1]|uniref:Uncharacterized protein n=1 Tax=Aporhodopirellula aestuarii TaxID=2950107 RepID=A0ABT0U168_9BACT|nr:hypothetical protein [Aporhodopirellula aestuarii]